VPLESTLLEHLIARVARALPLSIDAQTKLACYAWRFHRPVQGLDQVLLPAGFRMGLDLSQWQDRMMAYGLYENRLLGLMRAELHEGDHFVDVGGNLGFFALHCKRIVGEAGRVDTIEPVPNTCRRLLDNLALNAFAHGVRVHPVAAGETAGMLRLVTYGSATGLSSAHDRGEWLGKRATVAVPQVRLDVLLKGTSPRFVKVDVEGWEHAVLRGSHGLLASDRPPAIAFEYAMEWSAYTGEHPMAPFRAILSAQPRYRFYHLESRMAPLNVTAHSESVDFAIGTVIALPDTRPG
jgi:FkbM family methyltransferase